MWQRWKSVISSENYCQIYHTHVYCYAAYPYIYHVYVQININIKLTFRNFWWIGTFTSSCGKRTCIHVAFKLRNWFSLIHNSQSARTKYKICIKRNIYNEKTRPRNRDWMYPPKGSHILTKAKSEVGSNIVQNDPTWSLIVNQVIFWPNSNKKLNKIGTKNCRCHHKILPNLSF